MFQALRKWLLSLPQTAGFASPEHLRTGAAAEKQAERFLKKQGLRIIARNYKTPGRGGGEIDLIAQDGDTLVFVEVRQRSRQDYGGAAASVGRTKQKHLRFAAQRYLQSLSTLPPCRFDVLAVDGEQIEWLRAAFD